MDKNIKYSGINKLPTRNDFLDDNLVKNVNQFVRQGKPILFMPTDLLETNEYDKGTAMYKIYMSGITMDGQKACVILENIPVYIDIRVPDGRDSDQFENFIRECLQTKNVVYRSIKTVEMFPLKLFRKNKSKWKRITFDNLYERKKARDHFIRLMNNDPNIELASDDQNKTRPCDYIHLVARTYQFNTCDWNQINKYEIDNEPYNLKVHDAGKPFGFKYVFRVDINDIKPYGGDKMEKKFLSKDSTVIMCWDIETAMKENTGEAPTVTEDYLITIICISFYFQHSNKPFYTVAIVDRPTMKHKSYNALIECNGQAEVIKAFCDVFERFSADICTGFNTGGFDWPIMIEMAKRQKLCRHFKEKLSCLKLSKKEQDANSEEDIAKYLMNREYIKISPEEMFQTKSCGIFGCLDTDTMPTFKRLYPKMETRKGFSLNYFLKRNNLPTKLDKYNYTDMHHIFNGRKPVRREIILDSGEKKIKTRYVDATSEELFIMMKDLTKYCIVDEERCQLLFLKRNIIADLREKCNMSYVPLHDGFYKADGAKVRNLIGAKAHLKGIAFSNIPMEPTPQAEEQTYPGAWVFHPKRGLNDTKPVTGLDYSSLYPSLMMCYNFSPDKIIRDDKVAQQLQNEGYSLHRIEFPMLYKKTKKPTGQMIKGWTVRHNGVMKDGDTRYSGEKGLLNENMGLFPGILKELFDFRKVLKTQWRDYEMQLEKMVTEGLGDTQEYKDLEFKKEIVDSKQKAVKVFMNTFYGETGNKRSPVYIIEVSGGITTSGRYNIKMVADYVESKQYEVQYGDSVTAETPILCKIGNIIQYRAINELSDINVDSNILDLDKNQEPKYYMKPIDKLEVWTETGWTTVKRVIKHKTNKKIFRVLTHTGYVEVTEDHSLLDINKNKISINNLNIGDKLLHSDLPSSSNNTNNTITNGEAYLIGKLYDVNKNKSIPDNILNASPSIKKSFLEGFAIKNCNKHDKLAITFNCANQINIANFYYIMSSIGLYPLIDIQNDDIIIYSDSIDNSSNVIKKVELLTNYDDFVYDLETENHHFAAGIGRIIVHNTDSVYITCPDKYYTEINKDYELGKIDKITMMTRKVEKTFEAIAIIRDEVNEYSKLDNGTPFLSMAYEEVLFPVVFCGKKKYFGYEHQGEVNFKPKHLFIRGIEVIKQGQSELAKELGYEIMWEITNPDKPPAKTLLDITNEKLDKFYNKKWDLSNFKMFAKYKPNKNQVSIHSFLKRAKAQMDFYKNIDKKLHKIYKLEMPEAGEHFEYVIVRKPQAYNIRGCKEPVKVGDKMEFTNVYLYSQTTNNPMEIDLEYYLEGALMGTFARFICYYSGFQPEDITDPDDIDEYSFKMAKKHIMEYTEKYRPKLDNEFRGRNYQAVYRHINDKTRRTLKHKIGPSAFIFDTIDTSNISDKAKYGGGQLNEIESNNIIQNIKHEAQEKVDSQREKIHAEAKIFIDNLMKKHQIYEIRNMLFSEQGLNLLNRRLRTVGEKYNQSLMLIDRLIPQVFSTVITFENSFVQTINSYRQYIDENFEKVTKSVLDKVEDNPSDALVENVGEAVKANKLIMDEFNGYFNQLFIALRQTSYIGECQKYIAEVIDKQTGQERFPSKNEFQYKKQPDMFKDVGEFTFP